MKASLDGQNGRLKGGCEGSKALLAALRPGSRPVHLYPGRALTPRGWAAILPCPQQLHVCLLRLYGGP